MCVTDLAETVFTGRTHQIPMTLNGFKMITQPITIVTVILVYVTSLESAHMLNAVKQFAFIS